MRLNTTLKSEDTIVFKHDENNTLNFKCFDKNKYNKNISNALHGSILTSILVHFWTVHQCQAQITQSKSIV